MAEIKTIPAFKDEAFPCRHGSKGFTLIEVITVLSILGILSVIVFKNAGKNNSDLLSFSAGLKTHIRYCQSKAMQTDTAAWGIRIDAGTDEYWLFSSPFNTSSNWTGNRTLPPGAEGSPAVPNTQDRINAGMININISPIQVGSIGSASQVTLVFDRMGVPYATTGTGTISFSDSVEQTGSALPLLTGSVTISMSDRSGNTKAIVAQNETGFIP
jgi:prepilin-type N-terminal cleavage/methylation domain-containing protein